MGIAPQHQREAALRRLVEAHEDWCIASWRVDEASKVRALAMGDAYRAGATMTEIGERLGIGHSAISHAMRRAGLEPATIRSSRPSASAPSGSEE